MEKCSGVPSGFPFPGIVGAAVQRVASGPLAVMPTYGTMLLPPARWPNFGSGEGGVFSPAYWDAHGNSASFRWSESAESSMRVDAYAPNIHKPTRGLRNAGVLLRSVDILRLCTLDIDDIDTNDADPDRTPNDWPDHLDEAIRTINAASYQELLWGRRWTQHTNEDSLTDTTGTEVEHHLTLTDTMRSQGHTHMTEWRGGRQHTMTREGNYDTRNKLLPRWSPPRTVIEHIMSSYRVARLYGMEVEGTVHMRRMRRYVPYAEGQVAQAYPTAQSGRGEMDRAIEEAEEDMAGDIGEMLGEEVQILRNEHPFQEGAPGAREAKGCGSM
ncbi:hypothetical protein JB92DRAFT_3096956 [Gautieria morchelliformis]|nr:hypothetical protein JB92DRAFT_3096956 [Gautieria morchelliformis]